VTPRGHERLLQPLAQQVAVGQQREAVVVRLVFELLLIADQLSDVVHDADVVRRAAVEVGHRRDQQLVPEERAVLAVIAQHGAHLAVRDERLADRDEAFLVAIVAVQEAAVESDHFDRIVARDAPERRVRVLDLVAAVRSRRRDQNRVHAGVERAALQAQRQIGALARGGVGVRAEQADHAALAVEHRQLACERVDVHAVDHHVDFEVDVRQSRFDHFAVLRTNPVGVGAPRQVVVGLADDLLGIREPRIARERHVAAEIARPGVLPEDPLRDVVDHRFEHLVRALRFGFGLDLLGDVVGEHEDRLAAKEGQRMARDVRVDDRAVAAPVTPDARHRADVRREQVRAREVLFEPPDVLGRADVADRHREEFFFRVAVLLDGGRVDGEKAQRLAVEDVHRHGVRVEEALEALAARAHSAQLLAGRAFARAERVEEQRRAGEQRDDQERRRAARRSRRFAERGGKREILRALQRRERLFDAGESRVEPHVLARSPRGGAWGGQLAWQALRVLLARHG